MMSTSMFHNHVSGYCYIDITISPIYDFLLVFHNNYRPISYRFRG